MLDVRAHAEQYRRKTVGNRSASGRPESAVIVHVFGNRSAEFQKSRFETHLRECDVGIDPFVVRFRNITLRNIEGIRFAYRGVVRTQKRCKLSIGKNALSRKASRCDRSFKRKRRTRNEKRGGNTRYCGKTKRNRTQQRRCIFRRGFYFRRYFYKCRHIDIFGTASLLRKRPVQTSADCPRYGYRANEGGKTPMCTYRARAYKQMHNFIVKTPNKNSEIATFFRLLCDELSPKCKTGHTRTGFKTRIFISER